MRWSIARSPYEIVLLLAYALVTAFSLIVPFALSMGVSLGELDPEKSMMAARIAVLHGASVLGLMAATFLRARAARSLNLGFAGVWVVLAALNFLNPRATLTANVSVLAFTAALFFCAYKSPKVIPNERNDER